MATHCGGRPRTAACGSAASRWGSVVLASSGCAASNNDDSPMSQDTATAAAAPTEIAEPAAVREAIDGGAKVIDVRTPEEFAVGHLQWAVNIDLAAADFDESMAALDMAAGYVVYWLFTIAGVVAV